ncbi:SNF2 family N-terminal domain-containing protein [Daldinia caldariorum]|uniref:SNF2 family N-terminal domain-containing protein n=1 Tax=Daldinia caldariorum TaxID=326644 RepID=UPI0020076CCE|nr:SNF2 family N-terminal domain-containing protein [Daldinia caldariorum]KAI1467939.1 SNF2 family N-terminal domain-containing protein [Daldinia caldariorum]
MDNYEICYGTLYDAVAQVKINKVPRDINGAFMAFPLRQKDHYYVLLSQDGTEFGILDTRSSLSLKSLDNYQMIRFEAVVSASYFTKRRRKGSSGPSLYPLSINIFGLKPTATDVAYSLSKASAYLQHPESLEKEAIYENPQFLTFSDENQSMNGLIGTGNRNVPNSQTNISGEINNILESLTNVNTDEDIGLPTALHSKLKRHQEDGLRFIYQRENETVAQKLSAQVCHNASINSKSLQIASFGGLIADTMGLGKSLTMLAAILGSVPAAELFSSFYNEAESDCTGKYRTKATLIVVPSSQLLESWQSEIQTHIDPGMLSFISFHGKGRPRDKETLNLYDIVLTTYATLAADYADQGILHQMQWFRVVLDEAHFIKNSNTRQFRASATLYTTRRWCLTGTPIQNKLEDLASLAQFLRLPNTETKAAFQRHILSPLSEGGVDFAKPLRAYLEAYCLRRSEKCLNLPKSSHENVMLSLSPEERRCYDNLLDETRRQIDSLVSKRIEMRTSKLFTAMLKLRILCNLGTFRPTCNDTSLSELEQSYPEIGCEYCKSSSEEMRLLLDGCSACSYCGKPLYRPSSSLKPSSGLRSDAGSISDGANTPYRELSQTPMEQRDLYPGKGYSTKLFAVVQNVARGDADNKSIVFSYWTSTLNILQQLFNQAGISCRQIDGKVSPVERSIRLRAFKEDPQIRVLLMSIGTGAVGLNLAVANQVHIVEPQWNPSVEEQAIARALRMGQTKEVEIFRYVMEKTVEQNIVSLQRKKKHLAKFTFDAGTEETQSGALDDIKFVLDMGSA